MTTLPPGPTASPGVGGHGGAPAAWRRPVALALGSAALILAFYLLREHWGHALGALPYLLLLACPLMHLLHHGHGGHGGETRS